MRGEMGALWACCRLPRCFIDCFIARASLSAAVGRRWSTFSVGGGCSYWLLRLRCAVQHYEWGQRGAASLVARLADQNPDPARPYAELWMGTHPSGPSTLLGDGALLRDWLARNPDALGPAVTARWGGDLPFLFKVLRLAVDERFRALDEFRLDSYMEFK